MASQRLSVGEAFAIGGERQAFRPICVGGGIEREVETTKPPDDRRIGPRPGEADGDVGLAGGERHGRIVEIEGQPHAGMGVAESGEARSEEARRHQIDGGDDHMAGQ